MNALPNAQTNGIPGLLQAGQPGMAPPQGMRPGMSGPQGAMPPGMPMQAPQQGMPQQGAMPTPTQYQQGPQRQQPTPLDPKLIQAFEQMKLRQAAQRQQALQQPKMPPVIQQLQQQAMQTQPERQVPDGGARQVPGMAGGGIVAFSGGEEVRNPLAVLNPGDMLDAIGRWRASGKPLLPYLGIETERTVSDPHADDRPQRRSLKGTGPQGPTYSGDKLSDETLGAVITNARRGHSEALNLLTAYTAKYPLHAMQVTKRLDSGALQAAEQPAPSVNAPSPQGPRPEPTQPGAQPAAQAPQTPQTPAPQGLEALLEQGIRKGLETDPTKERDTQSEWYKQQMGMEPLLAKQEERLKGIEDLYAKQRKPGIEEWLSGLANTAPGNNPAAGLGAAGQAFLKAQGESQARDLDLAMKMANARDTGMKLQLEGNKGIADAGIKGLGEARRTQSDALTQGVGLQREREASAQRLQTARDSAAARLNAAKEAAAGRNDTKMLMLLQQAEGAAAREAQVLVEQEAKKLENLGKPLDTAALFARFKEQSLARNPAYLRAMQELGIPTQSAPAPEKAPGDLQSQAQQELARRGLK